MVLVSMLLEYYIYVYVFENTDGQEIELCQGWRVFYLWRIYTFTMESQKALYILEGSTYVGHEYRMMKNRVNNAFALQLSR